MCECVVEMGVIDAVGSWFTMYREAVMTTQRELNTALRHAISSSSEHIVAIILPWRET